MRRRNRVLDKSVIVTFLIFSLLSVFVSAYKLSSGDNCNNVSFDTAETEIEAGKVIHFVNNHHKSSGYEWSFGDSTEILVEKNPLHIFRYAGKYPVKLKINNSCEVIKYITVKSRKIDSTGYPTFVAPLKAMVGEKVRFFDTTKNAVSWEWRFGESFDKVSNQKDPYYVYNTPGLKNIILVVNGKNKYYTKKQILVLAKPIAKAEPVIPPPLPKKPIVPTVQRPILPPPVQEPVEAKVEPKEEIPAPPVKKPEPEHIPPVPPAVLAPDIDGKGLKKLFEQIQTKKKNTEDVGTYVCDHFNIPVDMTNVRNSSMKTLTLRDFTRNLKGLIITDVFVVKDHTTRCITSLKVEYKYSDW